MSLATVRYSLAVVICSTALAQNWEVGGSGGLSVHRDVKVTQQGNTASAGFSPGAAFSAFATQNLYEHLAGEVRYTFQFSDLRLSSGSTKVTFAGQTHALHYDVLLLGGNREAPVRPFAAFGGGMKLYRGTGTEEVFQPLANFALLTKTQQIAALATFGGGVKFRVSPRIQVRVEVRDYFTRTPKDVIAPNTVTGAHIGGWMHNIVPTIGLSFGI